MLEDLPLKDRDDPETNVSVDTDDDDDVVEVVKTRADFEDTDVVNPVVERADGKPKIEKKGNFADEEILFTVL